MLLEPGTRTVASAGRPSGFTSVSSGNVPLTSSTEKSLPGTPRAGLTTGPPTPPGSATGRDPPGGRRVVPARCARAAGRVDSSQPPYKLGVLCDFGLHGS